MNISIFHSHRLSRKEMLWGTGYLLFEALFLAKLLQFCNQLLPSALPQSEINALFFAINFVAVLVIFRSYLRQLLQQLPEIVWNVLLVTVAAFMAYWICRTMLTQVIYGIDPDFTSNNDVTIQGLVAENFPLMFFSTVILVPVAEEMLFRGLLFRGVYDHSPALAWIGSVALFSAIHVTGYIGSASAMTLLLCFIQYLPAGICLAGAYRLSGSLLSPILIHALVNFFGMMSLR